MRFMASAPARVIMRTLARTAGVERSAGALALRPRRAVVRQPGRYARARRPPRAACVLEKTLPPEEAEHPALRLEQVFERDLS